MCIGNRCSVAHNSWLKPAFFSLVYIEYYNKCLLLRRTSEVLLIVSRSYVSRQEWKWKINIYIDTLFLFLTREKNQENYACIPFKKTFSHQKIHPQIALNWWKTHFFFLSVEQIKPTVALISLNLWRATSVTCLSLFFVNVLVFFWNIFGVAVILRIARDWKKGGMGSYGLWLRNRLFCSVAFRFYLLRTCSWQTNVIKLIASIQSSMESARPVHTI